MKRPLLSPLVVMIAVIFGCSNTHQEELLCQEPFVLDEFHVWKDGGSLSFVFICGNEEELSFRLDGGVSSPTNGYFFLEVDNTWEKLPLGGTKEKSLIAVLQTWLYGKFTVEELEQILKSTDYGNMTKDDFAARHIKRLIDFRPEAIKYLKKQRPPSS